MDNLNLDSIYMADKTEPLTGVSRFDPVEPVGRQTPIPTAESLGLGEPHEQIDSPENIAEALETGSRSLVRGSAKGLVGLPADMESLVRGIANLFTEEDKGKLDAFIEGMSEETFIKDFRYLVDEIAEKVPGLRGEVDPNAELVGEFVSPVGAAVKAGKGVKAVAKKVKGAK